MDHAIGAEDEDRADDLDVKYLVILSKLGYEEATMEMYDRFTWFLLKYRALLKSGIFSGWNGPQRRDVRAFIALYGKSKNLGNMLRSSAGVPKNTPGAIAAIANIIGQLHNECKALGIEEVDSIIDMTFFQCLGIYDPKRKVKVALEKEHDLSYDELSIEDQMKWDEKIPEVGFEGFIFNYFHFLLRKNLDSEINGLQAGIGDCMTGLNVMYDEDMDLDEDDVLSHISNVDADMEAMIKAGVVIDYTWEGESSAQWPWTELSHQERWLLKQRYYNRRFACRIADSVGMSATVIRSRIKNARNKMFKIFLDDHMVTEEPTVKQRPQDNMLCHRNSDDILDRYESLCGEVTTRKLTKEELDKYK